MNTKRIWTLSIVFGVLATAMIYLALFAEKPVSSTQNTKAIAAENKEAKSSEKAKENKVEVKKRKMINPMVEVSPGKRAISLRINLEQGVSGYVQPNSLVDIIAYQTTRDETTKKEYKSAVLALEEVKVLAAGKSSNSEAEMLNYETVTVEVSPEDAVMLGLAVKDKDGLYLLLRNDKDTATGKKGLAQTREVLKDEEDK